MNIIAVRRNVNGYYKISIFNHRGTSERSGSYVAGNGKGKGVDMHDFQVGESFLEFLRENFRLVVVFGVSNCKDHFAGSSQLGKPVF